MTDQPAPADQAVRQQQEPAAALRIAVVIAYNKICPPTTFQDGGPGAAPRCYTPPRDHPPGAGPHSSGAAPGRAASGVPEP
ncbi:hypothetical protein SAMN05216533_0003 [Streptomyces sp. Ag109_O5-10]|nr:hypothetical protein SAMN05216533_0003 [Streptomyces sp. Ag109_O5-10]